MSLQKSTIFEKYKKKFPMLREVRISIERLKLPLVNTIETLPICNGNSDYPVSLGICKVERENISQANFEIEQGPSSSIKEEINDCEEEYILPDIQLICANCLEQFSDEMAFEVHTNICKCLVQVQASKVKPIEIHRLHKCNTCKISFKTSSEFESHICVNLYSDPQNDISLQPLVYKCETCSRVFNTKIGIKHHMNHNLEHEMGMKIKEKVEKEKCEICSFRCENPSMLRKHMKRKHCSQEPSSGTSSIPDSILSCMICGESFDKFQLAAHMNSYNGIFSCDVCPQLCRSEVGLKKHKRIHGLETITEGRNSCGKCQRKFKTLNGLKVHFCLNGGEKNINCDHCEKKFQKMCHLKTHVRRNHGINRFECSYCDKIFSSNAYLREHSVKHTEVKPYECQICLETFKVNKSLAKHMKIHTDPPDPNEKHCLYECDLCNRKFDFSSSLSKHKNKMHNINSAEKSYECQFCFEKFKENTSYTIHMRTHTGETPCPYECEICNKKYPFSSGLARHMKTHKNEILYPYKCDVCNTKFSIRTNLNRHINQFHKDQFKS